MRRLKLEGEAARTVPRAARTPAPDARAAAFAAHYARTVAFTDELRALRCQSTDHFSSRITETFDAFRALFGPWNAEITFFLYMHGPQRFNALKRGLHGVSSRVLTDKLRALEADGVLAHREDRHYALTNHGERLARLIHPLVFYVHNPHAAEVVERAAPQR